MDSLETTITVEQDFSTTAGYWGNYAMFIVNANDSNTGYMGFQLRTLSSGEHIYYQNNIIVVNDEYLAQEAFTYQDYNPSLSGALKLKHALEIRDGIVKTNVYKRANTNGEYHSLGGEISNIAGFPTATSIKYRNDVVQNNGMKVTVQSIEFLKNGQVVLQVK